MKFLRQLFDTSDRDVKAIVPIAEEINVLEPTYEVKSDEQLRAKTEELKRRLAEGESIDRILPEAFAAVREASKRTLGMRQFDVQMVGSVVLHHGRIAEMKTGEGKTLVAVAPLYLHALTGRGAHLVTVNDYLARRDAVWMGPIFHVLGISVGVIQGQSPESDELGGSYRYVPGSDEMKDPRYLNLVPCSRREAYLCDVTYGTNHEFGFDYLRDNMAFRKEDLSMRELNFAIIDEVDSILIDEARTPHIISGPSSEDVSVYRTVDEIVRQLEPEVHYTADRKSYQASLTEEGMDRVEELLGIDNIASDPRLFHHINASVKAYGLFQRDVHYVTRGGEVVIVDENTGRLMFGRRFSDGLHQALEAKERVTVQRESQTIAVITFQNLFRLYNLLAGMTGTAKTEEDEFRKIYGLDVVTVPTHRPMVRVDHEDIVLKTEEAKFRAIAREILRLFTKQQPVLVGTRSIEMSEVVSARLTSDMLQRLVLVDRLLDHAVNGKPSKDTARAINEAIVAPLSEVDRQVLGRLLSEIGASSDPLSEDTAKWFLTHHSLPEANTEYLDEALKHGIPHNVLNAKYHEREAVIIAEAGRKGAVTIATNMAGRGVDILLGGRVNDELIEQSRKTDPDATAEEFANTFANFRRGGVERAAPPLPLDDQERSVLAQIVRELGGLYILGTERHESRRIDNQLRGRSGRQGDPGESRFFVSLEDQLWKIFNAKMLENPLLKAWPPLEEVKAKFLSTMIRKTQERIENHFFEARKHVLEYDDVLNSQREHIYGWRREVLLGRDVHEDVLEGFDELIDELIARCWEFDDQANQQFNYETLHSELNQFFPVIDYASAAELAEHEPGEALTAFCREIAHRAYDARVESLGVEDARYIERLATLQSINDRWQEHLQTLDYIREGINLRAYGQVDPLVAYKREAYDLFQLTLKGIRNQSVRLFFQARVERSRPEEPQMSRMDEAQVAALAQDSTNGAGAAAPAKLNTGQWPADADPRRVGRNDPCPCGSGKKFKACHYPVLRSEGVI